MLIAPNLVHAIDEPIRGRLGYHMFYQNADEIDNCDVLFPMTKRVGDWILLSADWWGMQEDSTRNPDGSENYDFTGLDQQIDLAMDNDLAIIVQVFRMPRFARLDIFNPPDSDCPNCDDRGNCDACCYSALQNDPNVIRKWRRFCGTLVDRYTQYRSGVFHFEIGNEPNANFFYRFADQEDGIPMADTSQYVSYPRFLHLAADTMHRRAIELGVGDQVKILGGAMSPGKRVWFFPGTSIVKDRPPTVFLNMMYEYRDEHNPEFFFDILSYHPYGPWKNPALYSDPLLVTVPEGEAVPDSCDFMVTSELHAIMVQHGDGDKPIWGTECGPSVNGPNGDPSSYLDEDLQAYWSERYLEQWLAWEFTGPLLWWNLHEQSGWYQGYGVLRSNWDPRPAYTVWEEWGNQELHVGEGAGFQHHDFNPTLVARLQAMSRHADEIRIVLHDQPDRPYLNCEDLDLSGPNIQLSKLTIVGVGHDRDATELDPGQTHSEVHLGSQLRLPPDCDLELRDLKLLAGISDEATISFDIPQGDAVLSNVEMVGSLFEMGFLTARNIRVENSLFANCQAIVPTRTDPVGLFMLSPSGHLGHMDVVGCTFHNNVIQDSHPSGSVFIGTDIVTDVSSRLSLTNSLFTMPASSDGATPHVRTYDGAASPSTTNITWCATNQPLWAAGIPEFAATTNRVTTPDSLDLVVRYVDPAAGDFRLRWDSQLLDKGDPDLKDFDLTVSDIGWQPRYPITSLRTGVLTEDLPVGNYQVAGPTLLRGAIVPGSTIRVKRGTLSIRAAATGPFERRIGDLTQPRTSIVGRETPTSTASTFVRFENTTPYYDDLATLRFEGVLFNYPPYSNPALPFIDWDASDGGVVLDGESVQFQNWANVSGAGGGVVDGGILFDGCTGTVHGLDFGEAEHTPGYLQLKDSRVDVENCTFMPSPNADPDRPCLKLINDLVGNAPSLHGNTFSRNPGLPDHRAPFLDVWSVFADLRHNQFLDCRDTPLVMSQSVLHADRGARNDFRESADFQDYSPIATLQSGYLNLFCGQNNFVVRLAIQDYPIVTWAASDTLPSPVTASWRENYWGNNSCSNPISVGDLNDPELALLPPWAIAEDNLDECVDALTPANPACPFEPYMPYELLKNGKLAEQVEDWIEAQDNYRWLLQLHAIAKECTEGTLRLKALGLHKTHGPEAYESVRDDLFAGADSSDAIKSFHQAMLQDCGGWCVEARWGNREAAVDTLEAWFEDETDPLNKDTIAMALLEIATYPPQGGMSAASPEALVARSVARQRAVDDLFDYRRGQSLATADAQVLPLRFEISNLYPNPFNARTTVEYALPRDGRLRVRVYNLLGQLTGTAFDGAALAGRHRLVLDGSDWASGLYFVTAEFDGAAQVRKMMLIK